MSRSARNRIYCRSPIRNPQLCTRGVSPRAAGARTRVSRPLVRMRISIIGLNSAQSRPTARRIDFAGGKLIEEFAAGRPARSNRRSTPTRHGQSTPRSKDSAEDLPANQVMQIPRTSMRGIDFLRLLTKRIAGRGFCRVQNRVSSPSSANLGAKTKRKRSVSPRAKASPRASRIFSGLSQFRVDLNFARDFHPRLRRRDT